MQKPFYLRAWAASPNVPKILALPILGCPHCAYPCQLLSDFMVCDSQPPCLHCRIQRFFSETFVFFDFLNIVSFYWKVSSVHPTDPLKTFAISFPNNLCKCNFHFPKYKYEHWNFSKNKDWEGKEISSIKSTWNKNHPSPFSWIYDQSTAGMLMNKKYWNLAG